jgi:hypothetical protein
MKNKLLLIALAFGLMSATCEPEEMPQETTDCNCGVIIEKAFFGFPNNFTILKVKNNCTNEVQQIELDGNIGNVNEQYCND